MGKLKDLHIDCTPAGCRVDKPETCYKLGHPEEPATGDPYIAGAVLVFTEMALQNYDSDQIAEIMRPLGFKRTEVYGELVEVGGKFNEWPEYCKDVWKALLLTEEETE